MSQQRGDIQLGYKNSDNVSKIQFLKNWQNHYIWDYTGLPFSEIKMRHVFLK